MGNESSSLSRVGLWLLGVVVLVAVAPGCKASHRSMNTVEVVGFRGDRVCVVAEKSLLRYEGVGVKSACYLSDSKQPIELKIGDCIEAGLAYQIQWATEPMSFKRVLDRPCDIPEAVALCLWDHMQAVEDATGIRSVAKWDRDHPPCSSLK
jgi:hypothetical protein